MKDSADLPKGARPDSVNCLRHQDSRASEGEIATAQGGQRRGTLALSVSNQLKITLMRVGTASGSLFTMRRRPSGRAANSLLESGQPPSTTGSGN